MVKVSIGNKGLLSPVMKKHDLEPRILNKDVWEEYISRVLQFTHLFSLKFIVRVLRGYQQFKNFISNIIPFPVQAWSWRPLLQQLSSLMDVFFAKTSEGFGACKLVLDFLQTGLSKGEAGFWEMGKAVVDCEEGEGTVGGEVAMVFFCLLWRRLLFLLAGWGFSGVCRNMSGESKEGVRCVAGESKEGVRGVALFLSSSWGFLGGGVCCVDSHQVIFSLAPSDLLATATLLLELCLVSYC